MNNHLKNCPLCDAEPVIDGKSDDVRIRCESCGLQGPSFYFDGEDDTGIALAEATAIAAWNRRAPAPTSEPGARDLTVDQQKIKDAAYSLVLNKKDLFKQGWPLFVKIADESLATPASPAVPCDDPSGYIAVAIIGSEYTSVAFKDIATARAMCVKGDITPFWTAPVPSPAPVAPSEQWVSIETSRPELEQPVWLYEPGRGIWIGGRGDTGDSWLWGNCYGSAYSRPDGTWSAGSLEVDDDYQPTHWALLPTNPAASPLVEEAQLIVAPSVDQAKRLVGGEVAAWISVHDSLPEHRQTVAFVVDTEDWSRMSHLNGRVLGGQYDESSGNFSVPGLGVMATHWMPLPPPPDRASTGSATSTADGEA